MLLVMHDSIIAVRAGWGEHDMQHHLLYCIQVVLRYQLFDDRGAMLIWAVQRLPELRQLDIFLSGEPDQLSDEVSDRNGLPRSKDLADLHSRSLAWLRVSMLGSPDEVGALRLGRLPELRTCELSGDWPMPLLTSVDAASFHKAPKLQSLVLRNFEALQLQLGSLEHLTALTSLQLLNCGLRSVPVAVAALSATLCMIDLSGNERLQIDGAAAASILSCGRLRTFALRKQDIASGYDLSGPDDLGQRSKEHMEREGYFPAPFSAESLRHLMRLPNAFRKLHGHDLDVCLDLDDEPGASPLGALWPLLSEVAH